MNWRFIRRALWLKRSQWFAPERLQVWQERRLRALVAHAYGQCVYYRRLLDDRAVSPAEIRRLADLSRIPVLARRTLMEEYADLVARSAARFHPEKAFTTGTTGAQLQFLRDRETVNVGNAALWRFRAWHGIRFGDRIAEIRNVIFRRPTGEADYATVSEYVPATRTLRLNLLGADAGRRGAVARELVRFRPDAIRGTPMLLSFLSLYLLEHAEIDIRPRVVFAGSERLYPEQRRLIAEAFRAPVVEGYGNWEYAVFAGECEQGRLHLASEMGIVEILRGGRPSAPREIGEVTVTNLWNHSQPFVRYAIGDVGYFESEPCPCGRGLPTWRVVGGREKDLLATPTGFIYMSTDMMSAPRWRGKIAGIRFYQENRDEVLVQIARGPVFRDRDLEDLYADLNEYLGGLLRISFEFVEDIELTPGGKYRSVVSKVPIDV